MNLEILDKDGSMGRYSTLFRAMYTMPILATAMEV